MSAPDLALDVLDVDLADFTRAPTEADIGVVERCVGPVIDLGCGPGRLVHALHRRGVDALGVDLAPAAIGLARDGGAAVLRRDVFARLPGEGRWGTALLIDGNVGIGGDPAVLLARCAVLLRSGGRLLVEVDADDELDLRCAVQVTDVDGRHVFHQSWALVGTFALERYAADAGFLVEDAWSDDGRGFVRMTMR